MPLPSTPVYEMPLALTNNTASWKFTVILVSVPPITSGIYQTSILVFIHYNYGPHQQHLIVLTTHNILKANKTKTVKKNLKTFT